MMNRLFRLIATGFYTGYCPVAPGTVGSVLAWIILWVFPELREGALFILIGVLFFIGVWASGQVEKTEGHDASCINVDEMVGMWVSLLYMPRGISFLWWVLAFFLFRIFDVFKPFPIGRSQKLPGGWGVMMDDVLAGLYANLALRLFILLLMR